MYRYQSQKAFNGTVFSIYFHAQLIKAQQGNVALVTLPVLRRQTQGLVDWIPYLVICILSNTGTAMTNL